MWNFLVCRSRRENRNPWISFLYRPLPTTNTLPYSHQNEVTRLPFPKESLQRNPVYKTEINFFCDWMCGETWVLAGWASLSFLFASTAFLSPRPSSSISLFSIVRTTDLQRLLQNPRNHISMLQGNKSRIFQKIIEPHNHKKTSEECKAVHIWTLQNNLTQGHHRNLKLNKASTLPKGYT